MMRMTAFKFVIREGSVFEGLPPYFGQTIGVLPMDFMSHFPFQTVFIVESGDMLTSQMKRNDIFDVLGTWSRCVLHNSETGNNVLVIVLDRLSQYKEFKQDQNRTMTDDDFLKILSVVLTLNVLEMMFILLNQQLTPSPVLPYMRLFCNEFGFNAELFFEKIVGNRSNSPVMAIPFPN
jgi:hypothetical protein